MSNKYYFNGKNAKGCLKIAKGVFIEYGCELPDSFDKGKIKELEKRELITSEKSKTAAIHEIQAQNSSDINDLEKMVSDGEADNKKLVSKVKKLEQENKVLAERIEELEKGKK